MRATSGDWALAAEQATRAGEDLLRHAAELQRHAQLLGNAVRESLKKGLS